MATSKEKMLKAVERMEAIVDRYYGQNLQRELARLREALESDDNEAISEAISETVDGCMTATSQIRDLNLALDEFQEAHDQIQSELDEAIELFERAG